MQQSHKPILQLINLSVYFYLKEKSWFKIRSRHCLKAVDKVSFSLNEGETIGIVGESGCGKSTLARAMIGLTPITSGKMIWCGEDLFALSDKQWLSKRRDLQMVFQDPLASLDPRMTVGDIIAEPLKSFFPKMSANERGEQVKQMMEKVGLLSNQINRYPHEFSGGQCQRIGIARALISRPKILICDEPVSALDMSIQAQVVNLLRELQYDMGLSLIFIAHDLSVVKHISNKVLVMYLGQVVELGHYEQIYRNPMHPYTKALMAAVPIPDPRKEREKKNSLLDGELSLSNFPSSGCVFYPRCPLADGDCALKRPILEGSDQQKVACFKVDSTKL